MVIFLKYDVAEHINKYDKLLIPKGKPTTVSFINPAKKTKI
jgi:hypothetical protein